MLGSPAADIPQLAPENNDAVLESPRGGKFAFAWPPDAAIRQQPSSERSFSLNSSGRASGQSSSTGNIGMSNLEATNYTTEPESLTPNIAAFPTSPYLGHLQNPCGNIYSTLPHRLLKESESSEFTQFCELSLELAASVQMVVQTLLRVSPPQVLHPAKEQFAACSLPVPTPAISAILTSLKSLNYMSANMVAFWTAAVKERHVSDKGSQPNFELLLNQPNDFDVGELLQSVGDVLSGVAAHAGIDLVLYHGDVGIKHISVKGDESGLAVALSHVSFLYLYFYG
jgi:osomolarity two-component system, response regulator SSK1